MTRIARLTALLLLIAPALAHAQAWPSRPVTLIVANSPGTTPDVVARMMAEHLSRELGQRFLVEAMLGAAGISATVAAARAKPDGYTIYMSANAPFAMHPFMRKSLAYDPDKDFTPIALIVESVPLFIAVNPKLEAKSMAEVIALAKAQPGRLSWAGGGSLSPIVCDLLNKVAGIEIVNVRYKDTTVAVQDTIAGRTSMVVTSLPILKPLVDAGKLRVIALTSAKRLPYLPTVGTVSDALPGFSADGWFVLLGPAKFPAEIAERLNRGVDAFLKTPDIQKKMQGWGWVSSGAHTPQQAREHMRNEREIWKKIFQDVGFKPEPN
jgi:tripartite-type tricarboxylate transporter receptor subunit TctC